MKQSLLLESFEEQMRFKSKHIVNHSPYWTIVICLIWTPPASDPSRSHRAEQIFAVSGVLCRELKRHYIYIATQNESRSKRSVKGPKTNRLLMRSSWLWHAFPSLCCLLSCFQVELCTEGKNLDYRYRHGEKGKVAEIIVFSQYPRPADTPQVAFSKRQKSKV